LVSCDKMAQHNRLHGLGIHIDIFQNLHLFNKLERVYYSFF